MLLSRSQLAQIRVQRPRSYSLAGKCASLMRGLILCCVFGPGMPVVYFFVSSERCFLIISCDTVQTGLGFLVRRFSDLYCLEKVWKHQHNGAELSRIMELIYVAAVSRCLLSAVSTSYTHETKWAGWHSWGSMDKYGNQNDVEQLFCQLLSTLFTFSSIANPNPYLQARLLQLLGCDVVLIIPSMLQIAIYIFLALTTWSIMGYFSWKYMRAADCCLGTGYCLPFTCFCWNRYQAVRDFVYGIHEK